MKIASSLQNKRSDSKWSRSSTKS